MTEPAASADGPMIVFLHGVGGSPFTWDAQTAALPRGVRAAAPWLRGTRPGTSGSREQFTVADAAHDLATTLRFDGPAAVVGHGVGARVATRCALEYPESVSHLVLVGPVPVLGGAAARLQRLALKALPARRFAGGTPKEQLVRLTDELGRDEDAARLGELTLPVLVVVGERDRPARLAARAVTDALPAARLAVVPGAGHHVMRDAPEAFDDLVHGFVGA